MYICSLLVQIVQGNKIIIIIMMVSIIHMIIISQEFSILIHVIPFPQFWAQMFLIYGFVSTMENPMSTFDYIRVCNSTPVSKNHLGSAPLAFGIPVVILQWSILYETDWAELQYQGKYTRMKSIHLTNSSFVTGTFLKQLKIIRVVRIYKTNYRNNISNYRPVSVLPAISKVYEK